ncbi:MAG: response regulator transcription factor [Betaproteobacteria bacterium]
MRIAVLEDDLSQRELLSFWLKFGGHESCAFEQGQQLLSSLTPTSFDVLLLDWNLPDLSGLEVLKQARRISSIPIVFCTARDHEEDIAKALRGGADDYIVKPMRRQELLARVSSVARRTSETQPRSTWIEVGAIRFKVQERKVTLANAVVVMSSMEFDLAAMLLSKIGRLLTRSKILEAVFPNVAKSSRTVDTHIARLRDKLNLTADKGWRLSAIYGHGYRLERLSCAMASKERECLTRSIAYRVSLR